MAGATATSKHNYGTFTNLDTLRVITATSVLDYGEDRVLAAIRNELDFYNAEMNEAIDSFCERTFDQQRSVSGTAGTVEMDEIDELGTPPVQKVSLTAPTNLGFPLRKYGIANQWTRTFFQNATPFEMAVYTNRVLAADRRLIYKAIRRALFRPSASQFRDRLTNNLQYWVYPLANNDGFPIPPGPNNEYFDPSTHNHYLTVASADWNGTSGTNITNSSNAVQSLITTVQEHYADSQVMLYVNRADATTIQRLAPNFSPFLDVNLAYAAPIWTPSTATYIQGEQLNTNPVDQYNRVIGRFNGVDVWIKPWIPQGYVLAFNANGEKVLAYRERREQAGNLQLVFENETHPLRGSVYEREFGVAVQERIGAAVLYVGASYTWNDNLIV